MAVDIKDVEQVAQDLQQKFDDFKAKNDKRVDAIEQEKGKLAGQVETLNGKLSELESLKSDLEKELLELKRPAGGAQNKVATEHKDAFVGFLRKGREDGLRDLERKALQVGTDEDGGYAVPEELDRSILSLLKDEVVMRQEATVITVGGSDYKKLVNLGGTASGWVGETDTRPQTATSRLGLIEPFMGKSTATRRPPRKCWMMPSSTWRHGSTVNWRPNLPNRRKLPLPLVTAPRSRKGSWPMNPPMSPIRHVRSVNFSILYPAKRRR